MNKYNRIVKYWFLVLLLMIANVGCKKETIKYASNSSNSKLLANGFEDVTGYFDVYREITNSTETVPFAIFLVTYDAPSNRLLAYKKYSNDGQKIGDLEWEGEYNRATMNIQRYFVNGSTLAVLDIINKDEMIINSSFFEENMKMVRRVAMSY